jgi:hypothetical protein
MSERQGSVISGQRSACRRVPRDRPVMIGDSLRLLSDAEQAQLFRDFGIPGPLVLDPGPSQARSASHE